MRSCLWIFLLVTLVLAGCGSSGGSGSGNHLPPQTAATPTFTPAAGTYTSVQSITISDATPGATIYYTTNGSTPNTSSTPYTKAIPVSTTGTIEAIAVAAGYTNSSVASAAYTINLPAAATPTFSPATGTFTSTQAVTISDATSEASIYYTTDGSTPTASSTLYSSPITVSATTTINAIAVASGYSNSPVASATYTFPTTATATFSPAPGTYYPSQTVTLSDTTTGAIIYYTTDGSIPTSSSTLYTGPINVTTTTTIKAIATADGFVPSAAVSGTYTISEVSAVSVVLSTDDRKNLMAAQPSVNFSATLPGASANIISVDETQQYQAIDGFGAAMTDSAAYLMHEVVPSGNLPGVMSDLFTRDGNGIGISFIRNPMGASDIARSVYSFDDVPAGQSDPTLARFSIAHDQSDIIPLLVQAKQLNPQLKIMANPWSPPGWMKDPATVSPVSMMGGSLLLTSTNETAFANYFVKYIQAYQAAGIPIDYISLQNEPMYVTSSYPSMGMDSATQTSVLRDYVLPALTNANLTSQVFVWDHNWDTASYPEAVLGDPTIQASPLVAGTAWHGYGGPTGAQQTVQNIYPTKGTWETEHSGGTWVTFPDQFITDFVEITHVMRNASKSFVKWSLALDETLGPNLTQDAALGGCNTCTPLITVNSKTGAVTKDIEYYTIGHYSKYALPGARRIYSSNSNGIVSVAFLNPDGSKALIAFNNTAASNSFYVQWGTQAFPYTLPAFAAATFTWSGAQSEVPIIPATSRIQASSYSTESGLESETTSDSTGGYDLGYLTNGAIAVYSNIDFGSGLTKVNVRSASNGSGGTATFYLDKPNGTPIAAVTLPGTGGWQNWQTVSANVGGAAGVHTLYVVFSSGSNVNWYQFQ
ncbi:MAG TPA: chitobiase/beta-hexosaminidase C-terminal domain-containing protein [Terracidiphilus sp.]